jgi:hypothetical protein
MSGSDEKLTTLHPDPRKKGASINKAKYEIIKSEILTLLRKDPMPHNRLDNLIKSKLKKRFNGSVSWYLDTVKLDLEAREVIERDNNVRPPVYRLR